MLDHGHPYGQGEEVICASPVSGFSRLTEEAESRGIRPDLGWETALPDRIPLGVGLAAVDGDRDGDHNVFLLLCGRHPCCHLPGPVGVSVTISWGAPPGT